MAKQNTNTNDELEFESMMKQRFDDTLSSESESQFTDEKLKEMNKKLPSWNLEPPFTFLK